MLRKLGNFLWFVFLVFLAMIVGWWLLGMLDSRFSGNVIGKTARAVENAADPNG